MYTFNTSFRKTVLAVGHEIGLEFISTKRQIENGTLMFNDPQSNVKYALYESGYVRRIIPIRKTPWGNPQTISSTGHTMYQLNKTRDGYKTTVYKEEGYTRYQKIRIMANPEEQLAILVKSVINWRNPSVL